MDFLSNTTESSLSTNTTLSSTSSMASNISNETLSNGEGKLPSNMNTSLGDSMGTAEIIIHMTVLIVGLFGNMVTIRVMVQGQWGKESVVSRYILLMLAISDSVMLVTHTLNQDFVKKFFGIDIRGLTNYGCKVFFIFYNSSKITSSWFVMALCFDRLIVVMFPLRAKSLLTLAKTKIFIFLNYTIVTSFNAVFSFFTEGRNGKCYKGVFEAESEKTYQAMMLAQMLLYTVIPIVTISTLTPIIINKLFHHYQKRITLFCLNLDKPHRIQQQYQHKSLLRTTTTLLTIVLAYILLLFPMAVFQQINYWQGGKLSKTSTIKFMFREICQHLEQLNYSINFFLYICSCSKFRACAWECLFGGLCRKNNVQSRTFSSRIYHQ